MIWPSQPHIRFCSDTHERERQTTWPCWRHAASATGCYWSTAPSPTCLPKSRPRPWAWRDLFQVGPAGPALCRCLRGTRRRICRFASMIFRRCFGTRRPQGGGRWKWLAPHRRRSKRAKRRGSGARNRDSSNSSIRGMRREAGHFKWQEQHPPPPRPRLRLRLFTTPCGWSSLTQFIAD